MPIAQRSPAGPRAPLSSQLGVILNFQLLLAPRGGVCNVELQEEGEGGMWAAEQPGWAPSPVASAAGRAGQRAAPPSASARPGAARTFILPKNRAQHHYQCQKR